MSFWAVFGFIIFGMYFNLRVTSGEITLDLPTLLVRALVSAAIAGAFMWLSK